MASDTVSISPKIAPSDSKAPRKKKGKAQGPPQDLPVLTSKSPNEQERALLISDLKSNGGETGSDSPYIRELQKNIRNVNKKLNSMQKVDAIVAENPGVSLEELVASKKINADQKAQAMKKPALQANLAQLEDQLGQYKKIDQEYQEKLSAEKEQLLSSHKTELEKLKEVAKAEATSEVQKSVRSRLLTLSRFLRAAAARRQQEGAALSEETQAFEGALLLVYGGDAGAVTCIEKIMDGADDVVPNTEGTPLSVTYAQLRKAALDDAPYSAEEAWVDEVEKARADSSEVEKTNVAATDPTVAHAGLTELDSAVAVNGAGDPTPANVVPPTGAIDSGAANATAEQQWDNKGPGSTDDPLSESFEMVPKDPTETENAGVPAQPTSTQSWADEASAEAVPPTGIPPSYNNSNNNGNDGFREVHHNRGGRGRGGYQGDQRGGRGRGPRGDGRGRGGFRGDGFRGRGRGGGGYRGRGGRENPNPNPVPAPQ